ncbi:MAG: glycosyltransferase family 4 protein [Bacteroidota bacterium]
MRILQLCHKPPLPATDGGCMAMHAVTKGLQQLGYEVNIISLHTKKHPFRENELSEEYLTATQLKDVYVDTEVNWVEAYSSLITRDSYNLSRFFTPDFDIELTKVLKKEVYDIVHLESLFMCPYIETIRKYCDSKIVLRAHNIEYKLWQRRAKNEKNFLKGKYKSYLSNELKKYEVHFFGLVDGIASITDQDLSEIQSLGIETPIVTIPFGLNLEAFQQEDSQLEENSVFHIGSMDWDPNIEGLEWFLNGVMPALKKKNADINFYLAGKKSIELQENKKFNEATIVGEVPSSIDFINSKDIMVVPLQSAGGMRIKIVEGMALGKPIVTTSIGAEGIEAEDGKHLLIANNEEEYIDAILKLRSDSAFKKRISANAKQLIQDKYDRKKIIKKLASFYQTLLSE